jgi:hypothetical protein
MSEVRCTVCGERTVLRSQFEAEGECPECGAGSGSLVKLDAYDGVDVHQVRCAWCGWTVDAGVDVTWDEDERQIFSVDDDCPVCEAGGDPGRPLEPAEQVISIRDMPEHAAARAAAAKLRSEQAGETVPVDVDALARAVGLKVKRGLFGHDGLLREDVIEVPEGHPRAERFVVAHELGHHYLRHQGDRHKIEPEANAFASELLIPRDTLRRELRTPQTISALARRFGASRQAVVYAVQSARLVDRLAR